VRVFLDTNVLASALATRGLCADLFESVLAEHDLLTSTTVLVELERILATKFRLPADLVRGYVELIDVAAERITDAVEIPGPVPDPDDVPILAAALAGQAGCFVTGDKALLELGEVGGLPILSPRQFWEKHRLGR
jgi:putative PIN family toxin of toxin-antitoxin system